MNFTLNQDLTEDQLELKQQIIAEITSDYEKSRSHRPGGISSVCVHSTIDEFIDVVKIAIDVDQKKNTTKVILKDEDAGSGGIIFEDPNTPGLDVSGVVAYSMISRAPGTMEGGNQPFNRARRELKPRVREVIYDHPDHPGEAVVRYSQWFDNYICFKIIARTAHRANELALWFEELMEDNRFFFAAKGIARYFFDKREEDTFQQIGNDGYYKRPLIYYVRTERTYELTEQKINNIVVSLTSLK